MDSWREAIHAVQLERGCTCAFVGSGGTSERFRQLVDNHRQNVDRVLATEHSAPFRTFMQPALTELRQNLDDALAGNAGADSQPSAIATTLYDVLTDFTQLIHVIMTALEDWQDASPQTESFKKRVSGAELMATNAFGHLKELYGFQRAFVCGVLALPEASIPSLPARAFADFVICMHRLRAEQSAVRATMPASLLHMLSAGFELHPSLHALQELMLRDFDVVRDGAYRTRTRRLHTHHSNRGYIELYTRAHALYASTPWIPRHHPHPPPCLFARLLARRAARPQARGPRHRDVVAPDYGADRPHA